MKSQKGVAIVEFVLSLPILLALMIGTGEVGHFLYQYDTLNKAVRDGARYLSANSKADSTGFIRDLTDLSDPVVAGTRNLIVYGNITGSGTALLPNLTVGNVTLSQSGYNVVVTVSIAYNPVFLSCCLPTSTGSTTITFPNLYASSAMGAL